MTADAAHVAAVARALLNTVCSCENREDEFAFLGCTHCDATFAVETLTPLIEADLRERIAADIEAINTGVGHTTTCGCHPCRVKQDAARTARGGQS